jgi:hypothetical protein
MRAALIVLTLAAVVAAAPPPAHASGRAGKPYACNPQAECLARASSLRGAAAEAARRDCARMPTEGTCFAAGDSQADRSSGRGDVERANGADRKRR